MTAPANRSIVFPVAGWLAVGLLAAVAWRYSTPVVARWADSVYEKKLAGDVALAGVEVAIGAIAGVVGLFRTGPGATRRYAAALSGTAGSSLIAWGVGWLLGAPELSLTAVVLLAPLVLSLVTAVGSLVAVGVLRDPYAD